MLPEQFSVLGVDAEGVKFFGIGFVAGRNKNMVFPDDGSSSSGAGQVSDPFDVFSLAPGIGQVGVISRAVEIRAAPVGPIPGEKGVG